MDIFKISPGGALQNPGTDNNYQRAIFTNIRNKVTRMSGAVQEMLNVTRACGARSGNP
jgi:hypothetical protein